MLSGSPVAIEGKRNVKPVATSADGSVGTSRENDPAATLPATSEASQRGTDFGRRGRAVRDDPRVHSHLLGASRREVHQRARRVLDVDQRQPVRAVTDDG